MEDKSIIYIVASECKPELDEKYNRWYDEIHIPMLLRFTGLKEVKRLRLASETNEHPAYLAVYIFESLDAYEAYNKSQERAAAMDEINTTWKEGEFQIKWRVVYQSLKTWKK